MAPPKKVQKKLPPAVKVPKVPAEIVSQPPGMDMSAPASNGQPPPAELLKQWAAQDAADLANGPRAIDTPPPPPAPEEPLLPPGVADRVLAMLRSVEPIKSIVDKLVSHTGPANAAAAGQVPPPSPTVNALRGAP